MTLTGRPPAALLPTPESPSTGWRKSTKVISEPLEKEEEASENGSQRGKEGERQADRRTEITEFIKADSWRQ